MGDEKDAFYVVRKGGVVGVYKSITDLESVLQASVIFFLIHFQFNHSAFYFFVTFSFPYCMHLDFEYV